MIKIPIMSPAHVNWAEFCAVLEGPLYCNFHEVGPGPEDIRFTCHGDLRFARELLSRYGVDVVGSLAFFRANGGHCDCEVLFNVEQHDQALRQGE